ncbi:MAG TPA: TonB family protein [Thermoanaerobaculia bacterium]|nr:TonB family protein [Thermoanaerobaculia bacterium]
MRVRTCIDSVEERIELIAGESRKPGGFSVPTAVSILVHAVLLILFIRAHTTAPEIKQDAPAIRFVELIRSNPREFVEAPGPEVGSAPITAPFSDANRRASMPKPTGDTPTTRPGDGRGLYTPPMGSSPAPAGDPARAAGRTAETIAATEGSPTAPSSVDGSSRIPALRTEASAMAGEVNWRSAIKEIGKVASIGGNQGIDLSGVTGGEAGSAEAGPLSFETQWYDWGEYAQSMISRIRVNWYNHMPQLIRTGMQGVVTIRFTIQRDGRLTEITLLNSSGVPPYDNAARKSIELSSPLNPLPKDFPKSTERVTAMFYYNSTPPVNR